MRSAASLRATPSPTMRTLRIRVRRWTATLSSPARGRSTRSSARFAWVTRRREGSPRGKHSASRPAACCPRAPIEITGPVKPGENYTPRGADMQPGEVALRAGRRIGGPELAVLATTGHVEVPVFTRPTVAIASTGDELIDPAGKPGVGQVRDSNRFAIAGALTALGCRPLQLPRAYDSAESLEATLREGLARADAVVLTGGSSVGERDLTPDAIDALGKPGVIVHGLRVKP